ncbi:MAG: hypothetical protein JXA42_17045 [Anaerolineales bacterium]|nr:hypothetical protein [Anaerolineales bacterium]
MPPQTALMPATYSLLDDLENLTVEDSQGRVFTYAPIADYPGWKLLEPWGRVCNPSQHPGHAVGGVFLPGQVLIHPVSTDNATIVTREFYPLIYDTLILDYAMADGAVTGSNGVLVSIMLTNEYNESIVVVPPTKVTQNRWTEQAVDLSRFIGQRVTLRLEVDAIGNTSYDWLEVELFLELAQQQ